MRFLFACGGTAGHINPALAIAKTIKQHQPNAEICFAGTPGGMESRLVPEAGYKFVTITVMGFSRSLSLEGVKKNLKAVNYLMKARPRARMIIKHFKPDVVIGTGGYVSGPIVLEAAKMGIRTLIHEQNAFPGVTTKLLSKKVDVICTASEASKKYFKTKKKIIVTGNPIRNEILNITKKQAREILGLDDSLCILSFGGSLGARVINRAAADIIKWQSDKKNINIIHSTGKNNKEEFQKMLNERDVDLSDNKRVDVRQYISNMDICLAAADLVICRSGAITLAELAATGKPSILIPSPYVAENHQYHNAMVLENAGAAVVMEEKDYDKDKLLKIIAELTSDENKLKELSKNAYKQAILDTTEIIYKQLFK